MADTHEKPKITLYWLDNSRSQRVVWLLEELGLDYDLKIFHRDAKTHMAPPELAKVHPLGKSPVVTVAVPGTPEPIVLAESGFIIQYLCDHFSGRRNSEDSSRPSLVPSRWKPGQEEKLGGETQEWMRYWYLMHYAEGSLMPVLLVNIILDVLKSPMIPFFVRPISGAIANRLAQGFVLPNATTHMEFLEQQLATSEGDFLCGRALTAADILMSFPLIMARGMFRKLPGWDDKGGKKYEKTMGYLKRLEGMESFRRAVKKIEEVEGKGKTVEKAE